MYRYLEIMNFGNGDKRTTLLSAFKEKSKEEIGHIISDYKVVLKLSESEYKEIDKLLEYKGEESYSELRAKIDKAIEYIKENFDKTGIYVSGSDLPYSYIEELLEILGDKE